MEDNSPVNLTIGGMGTNEPNTIFSNSRNGIKISGCEENADIIGNTIQISQDESDGMNMYGIYAISSRNVEINSNVVDGDQLGTVERMDKRGISLDNCAGNKTKIVCNSINAVEYGLQFTFDNNPITTGDNSFYEMDRGFTLGELSVTSGMLDNPQDYGTIVIDNTPLLFTSGNNFLGSDGNGHFGDFVSSDWNGYALYGYEYSGPNIIYKSLADFNSEFCDISPYVSLVSFILDNSGKNSVSGFTPEDASDDYDDCISCSEINSLLTPIGDNSLETDLTIVEDETSFPASQQSCYEWVTKFNLFSRLSNDEIYLRSDEGLETFYENTFSENIGIFYRIDSLVDNLSDSSYSQKQRDNVLEEAFALNESIEPDGTFEVNQKDVNEIYLNTIAHHNFSLTSGEISTVTSISNQCPYEGGPAVFIARNMYHMMIGSEYFDDRGLCLITPRVGNQNSEEKGIYQLFPNPTYRFSKFYYKTIGENSTELIVSDVL